ncbi:hypothetical protein [Spongiibacter sp.]|uniref:hypothetical protein n=1 Tax=Spongiibacter sp. TaxID=2024860 RepID=UPI003562706B
MKAALLTAVFVGIGIAPATSHAACALAAIMGAPELPSQLQPNTQALIDLRDTVNGYLNDASRRLEGCRNANPFVYNAAVDRLDSYADNFNRLVQRHNTEIVAAN